MDTAEDNTAVETPPAAEVSAKPATATVTPDLSSLVRTLLSLCVLSCVYPVLSVSLFSVWCVPCCLSLCVQSGAYPAVCVVCVCVKSGVYPGVSLCVSSLGWTLLALSLCPVSCIPCCLSLCVSSLVRTLLSLCVSSLVCTLLSVCVSSLVGTLLSLCVCPVWCIPCCLSVSSLVCTLLSLSLCGWPLLYWILLLLWLDLVCPKTHLLYFMYM